jgi:2,4-didehydro-3-deoxy-L-rhamnonate hydrolase
MKLVRYGNAGKEKPGLIDAEGKLRDLSAHIKDIGPEQLSDAALSKLRKLKAATLPLVKGTPRMGCPVARTPKFIAIGLNYADHAAEAGMPIPKEPIVFMKATSCIPIGKSSLAWSLARAPAMFRKKTRSTTLPVTAPSTT